MSGAIPGFGGALLNKVELSLSLPGLSLLSLETDSLGFRVRFSTTSEILDELLPLSGGFLQLQTINTPPSQGGREVE